MAHAGQRTRRLEGQRETTLPRDVVLRLVESVTVERVDEVATLRTDPHATEAVLQPRAEVAGELRPRAVGPQLMDADSAGTAQDVRAERSAAGLDLIAQHQVGVVRELVELPTARQRSAAHTVLRPAAAGADADVVLQPHRAVQRADPAQAPIGRAGAVQVRRARQAAERAADGDASGVRLHTRHLRLRRRSTDLGADRAGRQAYDQ